MVAATRAVRQRGAAVSDARVRALGGKVVHLTCGQVLASFRFLTRPLRGFRLVMSSDVVARVDSFYNKAEELADKGHLLRAAENYGRAAEAARALGEDNLVTLHMQVLQGNVQCCFVTAHVATVDPCVLARANRSECITLLSGAIAALERRWVGDTLLEGKCAAAEEAWHAHQLQQWDANMPVAEAASRAALVGYEAFVRTAALASQVLARPNTFAAECSYAQLQSFAQHVVNAMELMQQPRRHGNVALDAEADFMQSLRESVPDADPCCKWACDARLVRLAADAWQRLQRSGVVRTRHIEEHMQGLAPKQQANHQAAIQSSLTAPGLRTCALPGCSAIEAHPTHFKSCAACRTVVYCCREHQVAGWPVHKKACKAARKAAAGEEEHEGGASGGA